MNRELKVPAALAILVAGFAAMVYWCGKQDESASPEPESPDFADVDIEIKDRPQKPHLTGLDSGVTRETNTAASQADSAADDAWWAQMREEHQPVSGADTGDAAAETVTADSRATQPLISSRPVNGVQDADLGNQDLDFLGDETGADFLNDRDDELYHESAYAEGAVPDPIQSSQSEIADPEYYREENRHWKPVKDDGAPPASPSRKPEYDSYVIQPGDTLSRIARRFLGAEHRAAEIFEANRDVLSDPHRLRIGTKIVIPRRRTQKSSESPAPVEPVAGNFAKQTVAETGNRKSLFRPVSGSPFQSSATLLEQTQTTAANEDHPARRYTVQRGDSLERIAVKHYGSRSKAHEIFRANRDQLSNPNSIRAGMTLVIP